MSLFLLLYYVHHIVRAIFQLLKLSIVKMWKLVEIGSGKLGSGNTNSVYKVSRLALS